MLKNSGVTKRILLKVAHEENIRRLPSAHFICVVNDELYRVFCEVLDTTYEDLYLWFSKWTKEDFNLEYDFCRANDIRILETLVVDRYRILYPHIYYGKLIKSNGWMRVWVQEHMGKEIKRNDKFRYNEILGTSAHYSY